jgi:uncharacterized damage-inducible protein DinB
MQTKEAIRYALGMADEAMMKSFEELADAPLTFPTAKGGCHAMWVLGHLTIVEAMTHGLLAGEANAVAEWAPLFAPGTTPSGDAAVYPRFEEVRARYAGLRKHTLELLDGWSEADLDRQVANPPQGLESHFETYGKTLLTVAMHQAMHRSHLTDAARMMGRTEPVAAAA